PLPQRATTNQPTVKENCDAEDARGQKENQEHGSCCKIHYSSKVVPHVEASDKPCRRSYRKPGEVSEAWSD
ncbi:MAG: hypothetical protein WB814_11835, partial [Candidatus Sulfotelmatobacter sp.]